MDLDTHCIIVLGMLLRNEITVLEAEYEIDSHRVGLFDEIAHNKQTIHSHA